MITRFFPASYGKTTQTIQKGGKRYMAFAPTQPSYSGDGIAIWEAVDKNNKPFLKVKVLGGSSINCFKVEPKKQE